ncbi:alpha-tocopherol transfer protein-like [Daphnia pulex]|uniref:alpha-tocopherol transfer protein-like n=1 Tax=Daphnia pulex TaxID=6669 RepID=UPI001EDD9A3C|nr:alpha-tocopherol transfer protein-like [Daphnia pulex]XP_046464255.1 alpha-tocopherol transfer protein-like [Daphnia pulex]XP_046464257.1 alpha-tocopherol transfer protein-like [Daphnia pulex]XP_046464258.1 alpha-tocopherol transfer protein-like [Daphnia pulex]
MNNNITSLTHIDKELVGNFRLLIEESNINLSMSDELLMCFIHARKYDVNRSMRLLNNYIRMTKNYPELLTELRPARAKQVLDMGLVLASPQREQNGRRVFIVDLSNWDPRICCLEDVFRTVVFCFQRMMSEIETQTNGIVVILDFKDFTLYKVKQFTPSLIKTIADTVQDVFPIRLQGIHILNEPRILKILVAMFWPFLSNKIRNRLFFHGHSYTTLHKQIDPASLPSNYDGCLKPMETMHFSNVFPEKDYSKLFDCFN